MEPFWDKFKAMKPYLQPGFDRPEDGREYRITQERMNVIHKEALCVNCGCCVSECNAMESDPEFLGPQALAKGMRFVGDPRDGATVERLEQYSGEHGIWECTRCFFCNERCPKGVDPRDAIAKLGAEAIKHGIDRDMGAKHAKWFVRSTETTGWLRETELVPKTQGVVSSIKQMKFAMNLTKHNKAGLAFPPHVAKDVGEARNLHKLVREQDRQGALGHVQGEHALAKLDARSRRRARSRRSTRSRAPSRSHTYRRIKREHRRDRHEARRVLQGLPRLAVGEGAGHVDAGARAARRAWSSSSSSPSPAAAPATSTRRSPTTTST